VWFWRCAASCVGVRPLALWQVDTSLDVRVRAGCVGVRRRNRGLHRPRGSETHLWFDTGHVPTDSSHVVGHLLRCVRLRLTPGVDGGRTLSGLGADRTVQC